MKICLNQARKASQLERKIQLKELNMKILTKKGRLKIYRDKTKKYSKQDIPKQRKTILSASRRKMGENIPTTGCERSKKIWEQNMGTERS